ncbi:MAG: ComEC/Rec2 family competence protein [Candidatus Erginobacter occultus]|nr:ComEC/Rec2 family competence protein [Candidatus Erginobacter occultus]
MKNLFLAAVILFTLSLPAGGEEAAPLEIHFIDVGYGDAILLKSPEGGYSLIDTGPPRARGKLLDYLRERGVGRLEYLIVTHPHPDHLGNAAAVLREFGAANLRDNGEEIDRFDEYLTPEMVEEYEREFRGDADYSLLRAGENIEWSGLSLEVLWPRDLAASEDWNTNSLVLMLRHGEFRALLTGDFNTAGEKIILEKKAADLRANLLKVGHHGAGDAAGDDFLRAVSPEAAVVSVGENPWGYPVEARLESLEKLGIRLYRTDRVGTVVFRCRAEGTFARYPGEAPPSESGSLR